MRDKNQTVKDDKQHAEISHTHPLNYVNTFIDKKIFLKTLKVNLQIHLIKYNFSKEYKKTS